MTQPVTPNLLFAIDPSVSNLGYALLQFNANIVTCGFVKQTSDTLIDYHARGLWMAQNVYFLIGGMLGDHSSDKLDTIIEIPTNWFNQRGQQSKDNEAVQKLYYTVGCIVAVLVSHPHIKSIWCTSPVWKGNVPKKIMVERAQHMARAQGRELKKGCPHDTAEAILLARWALDRYEPVTNEFQQPLVRLFQSGHWGNSQFTHEEFIDYVDPIVGC